MVMSLSILCPESHNDQVTTKVSCRTPLNFPTVDRHRWQAGLIAAVLMAPLLMTVEVAGPMPVLADEAPPTVRELAAQPALDAIDLTWRTPDHASASDITAYELDVMKGGVSIDGYPIEVTVAELREVEDLGFGDDGPIGDLDDETPTGDVPDEVLTQPDLFAVVLTGLDTGTLYDVTVTPVGGGIAWGVATVQETPRSAPESPTALVLVPGETTIAATWAPPTQDGGGAISGYRVQVTPSSGGVLEVTDTEVTITGLNPETRTTVSVGAVNTIGESAPVIATTRTLAPVGLARLGGVAAATSGTTTTLRAPLIDDGRPTVVQRVGFVLSRTDPPVLDATGTTFVPAVGPPAGRSGTLTATTDLPGSGELWFVRSVLEADYPGAAGETSYGPTMPHSATERIIRFTTAGQSGRLGPIQEQANGFYSTGDGGSFTHRVEIRPGERGVQRYLVDLPGAYRVEAAGAAGGSPGAPSGARGAVVSGTFVFAEADPLMVVVGQRASHRVGGGGGTFLTAGTELATAEPLLVAGGGGGGGRGPVPPRAHGRAPDPGTMESAGQDAGMLQCGSVLISCGSGAGRTGGFGGRVQETSSNFHGLFGAATAGAGGGFSGDGATGYSRHRNWSSTSEYSGIQGRAFRSGAVGGDRLVRVWDPGPSGVRQYRVEGGFGGAGTGPDELPPGGGGGGYNGGGGGLMDAMMWYTTGNEVRDRNAYGGGGGSFNAGAAPDGASGANTGAGYVELRLLATVPVAGTTSVTGARAGAQATFSADVLSTGGDVAVERGFLLSQQPDATLDTPGVVRIVATGQGAGHFTAQSPTLPPRDFLYVRSYVSGFGGVGYGPLSTFATFRPFEFTTAGRTGPEGPDQAALDAAYSGTPLAGRVVTGDGAGLPPGVQRFEVPLTGRYRIQALGARGGVRTPPGFDTPQGGDRGGRGAAVEGTFELEQGDQLLVVVGQQPGNPIGGGGGSFVVRGSGVDDPDLEPLLIAGGGGAVSFPFDTIPDLADATAPQAPQLASETRSVDGLGGTDGHGGRTVAAGDGGGGVGGVGGGGIGGLMGPGPGPGGGGEETRGWAGAGGGLLSSGEDGLDILEGRDVVVVGSGGRGFVQGAEGGRGRDCTGPAGATDGGFGGGGAGSAAFFSCWSQGGSGGGYNGAGATEPLVADQYPRIGRGGGSYNAGTVRTDIDGVNLGDGRVAITLIPTAAPSTLFPAAGEQPRTPDVPEGTSIDRAPGGVLLVIGGVTVRELTTSVPASRTTDATREFVESQTGDTALEVQLDVVDGDDGPAVVGLLGRADDPDDAVPVPSDALAGVTAGEGDEQVSMLLVGADEQDRPREVGEDGEPSTTAGGRIVTVGQGLPPGAEGEVSVRSTPQLLGRFTVDDEGRFAWQVQLPHDLAVGDHTLVIATDADTHDGGERVVTIGVRVDAATTEPQPPGASPRPNTPDQPGSPGDSDSDPAPAPGSPSPDHPAAASRFNVITPTRVYDSRETGEPLPAGQQRAIRLTSAPTNAVGVTANITLVDPTSEGFVTVWPCGPRPDTSNINFAAGGATPNQVTVGLDHDRRMCVFTSATTHVIIDVAGWWQPGEGATVTSNTPRRIADTRSGQSGGPLAADSTRRLTLDVPTGTTAVSLNVTAVNPAGAGYVTVWPCSAARPGTSNLNTTAGVTRPNHVTVAVGSDHQVCFFTTVATDLIVDVTGTWQNRTGSIDFRIPTRTFDSRTEQGHRPAWNVDEVHRRTSGMLFANVTVANARADGYLSVFPCDAGYQNTSNLNFRAGETVANAVIVDASQGGVCTMSSAAADVIFDVFATAG